MAPVKKYVILLPQKEKKRNPKCKPFRRKYLKNKYVVLSNLKNKKTNHPLTQIWKHSNSDTILKTLQWLSKPIVVVLTIFVSPKLMTQKYNFRLEVEWLIPFSQQCNLFVSSNSQNHGLDSFRKANYRRHPIYLNDNIIDITQQKDPQVALSIQQSIDAVMIQNNERRSCPQCNSSNIVRY